mmetsp:Transcript_24084/g.67858  ORF Transcript_24084/g.67858 Transcript_24084/m.67858 type:complete len:282 (+) Transcript_24084:448-1293(+)
MLRNQLAGRGVLVLEPTGPADAGQQPMVRKEVDAEWIDVIVQLVNFRTGVVVNVHVVCLGGCEHAVVVQEACIPNSFLHVKLGLERQLLAVEERHVPSLPVQHGAASRTIVLETVWGVAVQLQIEDVPTSLFVQMIPLQLNLRQTGRAFHIILSLHEPGRFRVENDLGICGCDRRAIPLRLVHAHFRFDDLVALSLLTLHQRPFLVTIQLFQVGIGIILLHLLQSFLVLDVGIVLCNEHTFCVGALLLRELLVFRVGIGARDALGHILRSVVIVKVAIIFR